MILFLVFYPKVCTVEVRQAVFEKYPSAAFRRKQNELLQGENCLLIFVWEKKVFQKLTKIAVYAIIDHLFKKMRILTIKHQHKKVKKANSCLRVLFFLGETLADRCLP